jgi:putative phosphoesterase
LRIAVIADTHMPNRAKQLPAALIEGISGVDLIVHAGDWSSLNALEQLETIAPVEGVTGNNDDPSLHARFKEKIIIQAGPYRIGVTHGHGQKGTTFKRAWGAFEGEKLDVIIFGHSHIPYLEKHEETWVLNPGSPTDKRRQIYFSYAMIELSAELNITLHTYADKSPS